MNYSVVIPAAGQGKRMKLNHNKQFLQLENKPVIIHTLEIFQQDEWCKEIIVVANPNEAEQIRDLTNTYRITKAKQIVSGGSERQHSVYNGLKAVKDSEIVLIHDGARPFVEEDLIHKLVIETDRSDAAILAVPIKDTVKECIESTITHTVDRSSLYSAQTPQAFSLKTILEAHKLAEENQFLGTDDASLVENLQKKVSIVMGDYFNIKLTTQEDIVFARSILQVKRGAVEL
ncbi:2-C-methyl-D-erythritol 4-phosphate cytidylyltransferase [Anaerobacillus alkaliphilus]|uniref:2-C-methyl-D-erythritol 4-phosphate cytidylyltransferase n=1 Tax=Anaerobacillus alkaliphilus TaxID=1548597 RepID=A0A4Q0VVM4_9BACI|nr:2-C-methyl-D-erythritol 4-phosphate cytidylyltransferase [Anaerobacillus alkaliphilus]RXJ03015.1 2-C-methyl-D-erythritol 4-phosphate cytidylyltransferase [Anaerobacillus alkaliphilus]